MRLPGTVLSKASLLSGCWHHWPNAWPVGIPEDRSIAIDNLSTSISGARGRGGGTELLFTLGAKGGVTHGGSKVVEIGPVPAITAPEYLRRINHAGGAPGAKTAVHTHPGSEAFLRPGRPVGPAYTTWSEPRRCGQTMNGHGADTPMEVFSAGTTDLDQIVLFVVDATRPFSSPAKFE
jgi:hypothetical protein